MAETDGSVVIGVDMNTNDAEKELARLQKKIYKIEENLKETSYKRSNLAEQSAQMAANLDEAKAKLYEMENASNGVFSAERIEAHRIKVDELQKEWDKVERNIEKCDDAIERGNADLEYAKQQYGEVADEASRLPEEIDRSATFLDKFTKRIVGLAKRVFVFTLITKSLRSMRDWLGKAVKTNSEATAAIARLKGALLTLAQPLIEVIIPAFTFLVNVLTALIGTIAKFVSLLFGKSINQSAEAAKNLYEEQNALEGVGEAAEEAAGSLAGFDEINTIQTETTASKSKDSDGAIAPDFSFTDVINDKLEKIAKLVSLIGLGFLLWRIGSMLPGMLGTIFTKLGEILMVVGGLLLFWDGLTDAWENGVDWLNLIEMIGGLAVAAFGLYQLFGPIAAGIALIVGGIAMLVVAFRDVMENGWNLQNTLLAIAGIVATGLGFFFITGSVIPLVIAGIAALLLAFTVATGHGEELIAGIKKILQGFIDFFGGIFSGDFERTTKGIEQIFSGLKIVFFAVIDGIRDTFLGFLNWLDQKTGGKLSGIINAIKKVFIGAFDAIKQKISNDINAIKQIFTGIVQFVSGVLSGNWDRAWEGIKNIFRGAVNSIISTVESMANGVIHGINSIARVLNSLSFTIPDWVPGYGGYSFGFNLPTISDIRIPRLAQGAVIPPNREFAAVLGDQTSGYNIEAPEDLIRKIVREESGNSEILAVLQQILQATRARQKMYVKERVLAEVAKDGINTMTIQSGKPVLIF